MQVLHHDKKHGYVSKFDSVAEYVEHADTVPIKGTGSCHKKAAENDRSSWHGGVTWDEAKSLVVTGWQEGLSKLRHTMASASTVPFQGPALQMDVAGAYPISAVAAAGDPASMVNLQPVEDRVRPIVRLMANTCASCAYSAEQYMVYGSAIVSFIDALEQADFRVELSNIVHATGNRSRYTAIIPVKQAEEPLELDRIAYCFAHVSFLRLFGLQNMMNSDAHADLGSWCGIPANAKVGLHTDGQENVILLPGMNYFKPDSKKLKSVDDCIAALQPMIKKQLSEQGMPLPPLAFAGEASENT